MLFNVPKTFQACCLSSKPFNTFCWGALNQTALSTTLCTLQGVNLNLLILSLPFLTSTSICGFFFSYSGVSSSGPQVPRLSAGAQPGPSHVRNTDCAGRAAVTYTRSSWSTYPVQYHRPASAVGCAPQAAPVPGQLPASASPCSGGSEGSHRAGPGQGCSPPLCCPWTLCRAPCEGRRLPAPQEQTSGSSFPGMSEGRNSICGPKAHGLAPGR